MAVLSYVKTFVVLVILCSLQQGAAGKKKKALFMDILFVILAVRRTPH
jgi:hypothetical protein